MQDSDLRERIVAAVRSAGSPATFKGLAKKVGLKHEVVRDGLEFAVESQQVFRWPDYRRSQYFWHVSPEQAAQEAMLAAAAELALPKTALGKAATKKVPGLSAKRAETLLLGLVAEKKLQAVAAFTGSSKLFIGPGHSEAYFRAARSFLERKFQQAGFDPAAFFLRNAAPDNTLESARGDLPGLILEAIGSMETARGVPVPTLRLRDHFRNVTKHDFDTAALELRKRQEVFLSRHADPHNLAEADKDFLIDGQDGTYYVGVAIR